jgi:hypothetical protein
MVPTGRYSPSSRGTPVASTDGRRQIVEVTAAGRERVEGARQAREEWLTNALQKAVHRGRTADHHCRDGPARTAGELMAPTAAAVGFDRRLLAPMMLGVILNPIDSSIIAVAWALPVCGVSRPS